MTARAVVSAATLALAGAALAACSDTEGGDGSSRPTSYTYSVISLVESDTDSCARVRTHGALRGRLVENDSDPADELVDPRLRVNVESRVLEDCDADVPASNYVLRHTTTAWAASAVACQWEVVGGSEDVVPGLPAPCGVEGIEGVRGPEFDFRGDGTFLVPDATDVKWRGTVDVAPAGQRADVPLCFRVETRVTWQTAPSADPSEGTASESICFLIR